MGGQNALLFAVQKHDLESARMLLEAGVDVNVAAAGGTTPLLGSLYKWDPLGKEFIAGKGAPAPNGSSARFSPDLPMARFLLDRGATVNVADGAGYTPLHGAALAVASMTNTDKDRSAYGGGRRRRRVVPSSENGALPAGNPDEALALVRRLLDAGADTNRQTRYPTSGPVGDVRINPAAPGSSAFHIAADSSTWRSNATVFEPTGKIAAQVLPPGRTLVHEMDLSYAILPWHPNLKKGAAMRARYGDKVGFHYYEDEDCGIFWSNDPNLPVSEWRNPSEYPKLRLRWHVIAASTKMPA
jgi:hypothetical protein